MNKRIKKQFFNFSKIGHNNHLYININIIRGVNKKCAGEEGGGWVCMGEWQCFKLLDCNWSSKLLKENFIWIRFKQHLD